MADKIKPVRDTNSEAVALARSLIVDAHFGSLGVIDPESGGPYVSRVAVATDNAGAPIILISTLAWHTRGLLKDSRCSLLVGEPGKGDPLAHPRITLACIAEEILPDAPLLPLVIDRFLRHQPKAKLYISLPDFSFFRLSIQSARMNGGFGKAFLFSKDDFLR